MWQKVDNVFLSTLDGLLPGLHVREAEHNCPAAIKFFIILVKGQASDLVSMLINVHKLYKAGFYAEYL